MANHAMTETPKPGLTLRPLVVAILPGHSFSGYHTPQRASSSSQSVVCQGVTLYMGPTTLLYHKNIPFVTMVSEPVCKHGPQESKSHRFDPGYMQKGFLSGYEVGIVGSAISLGIVQLFNQLTTE